MRPSRPPSEPAQASPRKTILITATLIVLVFFALDDLLGLINGGGIFSFFAAAASVHRAAPKVEVDGAALRTGFMALCAMATAGAGVT